MQRSEFILAANGLPITRPEICSQWAEGRDQRGRTDLSFGCTANGRHLPSPRTVDDSQSGQPSSQPTRPHTPVYSGRGSCRTMLLPVWMYIPQNYTIVCIGTLFEFQGTRQSCGPQHLSVPVEPRPGASPEPAICPGYLYDDVRLKNYPPATTTVAPIGRWFLVEAFMHQATDNSGRVTFGSTAICLVDVPGYQPYPPCGYPGTWVVRVQHSPKQPARDLSRHAAITLTGP